MLSRTNLVLAEAMNPKLRDAAKYLDKVLKQFAPSLDGKVKVRDGLLFLQPRGKKEIRLGMSAAEGEQKIRAMVNVAGEADRRPSTDDVWSEIKDDVEKSVATTRTFVRGTDKLMDIAGQIESAAKGMRKQRRTEGGVDAVRTREMEDATKAFTKTLNAMYKDLKVGREAAKEISRVAELPFSGGYSQRKPRGAPTFSSRVGGENRIGLLKGIDDTTKELQMKIRAVAEAGARITQRGEQKILKRKSAFDWRSLQRELGLFVNSWVLFNDDATKVLFQLFESIKIRVQALVKMHGSKKKIGTAVDVAMARSDRLMRNEWWEAQCPWIVEVAEEIGVLSEGLDLSRTPLREVG